MDSSRCGVIITTTQCWLLRRCASTGSGVGRAGRRVRVRIRCGVAAPSGEAAPPPDRPLTGARNPTSIEQWGDAVVSHMHWRPVHRARLFHAIRLIVALCLCRSETGAMRCDARFDFDDSVVRQPLNSAPAAATAATASTLHSRVMSTTHKSVPSSSIAAPITGAALFIAALLAVSSFALTASAGVILPPSRDATIGVFRRSTVELIPPPAAAGTAVAGGETHSHSSSRFTAATAAAAATGVECMSTACRPSIVTLSNETAPDAAATAEAEVVAVVAASSSSMAGAVAGARSDAINQTSRVRSMPGPFQRRPQTTPVPSCQRLITTADGPLIGLCNAEFVSGDDAHIDLGAKADRAPRAGRYFPSIPFGQSTAGANRWRLPKPVSRWAHDQPIDLSAEPARIVCPQQRLPKKNGPDALYTEDCLRVYVWTPFNYDSEFSTSYNGTTAIDDRRLLPVLVNIVGGSFNTGAASNWIIDGTQLSLKGRVVVVNVNYRVNIMGSLAHDGLDDERGGNGNFQIADQRLGLMWVQRNIRAFGGDPNRVTLFGHSAGATSVIAHLVSPLSKGLFWRAIAQSHTGGLPLQTLAEAKEKRGNSLARVLNCERATADSTIACLRSKSWEEVVDAPVVTLGEQPARDGQLSMMEYGGPVMDGINFHDTSLLASIRAGRFHRVPLLTGTSRDEAGMYIMQTFPITLSETTIAAWFNDLFGEAAGAQYLATFNPTRYGSWERAFQYFMGHTVFGCPAHHVADSYRIHGLDAYVYQFAKKPASVPGAFGAFHGTDLPYIFHTFWDTLQWEEEDYAIANRMTHLLASFAAGNDTAMRVRDPASPIGGELRWPLHGASNVTFRLAPDVAYMPNYLQRTCRLLETVPAAPPGSTGLGGIYPYSDLRLHDRVEWFWSRIANSRGYRTLEWSRDHFDIRYVATGGVCAVLALAIAIKRGAIDYRKLWIYPLALYWLAMSCVARFPHTVYPEDQ